MTVFLYQLFIGVFQALMRLAGSFNTKIRLGVEGRSGLIDNLDESFSKMTNGRPVAWFHAASLGEFEQGRPVMEKFREQYPDYFILLTFFSPSGYEIRKNYAGADYICYLPIDTHSNAAEFVRIIKPRIVFFIKYEFWFNYLRELRKSGAYIFSFSTIFRPGQVFFKWYGGFYRKLLTYFDQIFVQNEESLRLLRSIQITQCSLAGDTRFDRVSAIAATVKDLPLISAFKNNEVCMVAGSVWEADMNVIIPAVNALPKPIKMIIAPHEIKMEEIEVWRGKLSGSSVLYSEFVKGNQQEADYLFIDNIGMLSSLYRYGDMAYIGGSFGSGLHNILEAATFGLPVTFGDKGYRKFQEAKDLIQEGGAIAVSGETSLTELIKTWSDQDVRTRTGKICKDYVVRQIGATEILMEAVHEKLNK